MLTKDRKGEIVGVSGLVFEVLDQISYRLNFSYIVREPADGKWGVKEVKKRCKKKIKMKNLSL